MAKAAQAEMAQLPIHKAYPDGFKWVELRLPEKLTQGYLFTTVGRMVNIEVAVPDAYSPEADALADLSTTIAKLDPVTP